MIYLDRQLCLLLQNKMDCSVCVCVCMYDILLSSGLRKSQVQVRNKEQRTEAYLKSSVYSPGNHVDPSNTEQRAIDKVILDSDCKSFFCVSAPHIQTFFCHELALYAILIHYAPVQVNGKYCAFVFQGGLDYIMGLLSNCLVSVRG